MGPRIILGLGIKNDRGRRVLETVLNKEIWKDIEGYEGVYQVSSLGKIKRLVCKHTLNARILASYTTKKGYLKVQLCLNGVGHKFFVHRLVINAFGKQKESDKLQVNHKDGIKTNNEVDNLEWVTAKENTRHAIDVLGVLYGPSSSAASNSAKLTSAEVIKIRELLEKGVAAKTIAGKYCVTVENIHAIRVYKTWKNISS